MRQCPAAIARAVVAFLDSVLMGCFLSCFRPRPDPVDHLDPLVPKNRFGDVFLDDEQGFEGSGRLQKNLGNGGDVDEELRREANYLKSCGAISETPVEFCSISDQINMENTNKCDNMSNNSLAMEGASIFEENPSEGCKCEEHYTLKSEMNTEDREDNPGVMPQSAYWDKSPFQNIKSRLLDSSDSPYPTPPILRDDMQTPGTIYTAYKGTSMSGKRMRTRKQFIYPVLRPIENKFKRMELREDSSPAVLSNPPKRRNLGTNSSKKPRQTSPCAVALKLELSKPPSFSFPNDSACQDEEVLSLEESKNQIDSPQLMMGGELSKYNSDDEKCGVSSLSHWLKPSLADDENQDDVKCPVGEELHNENSLFTDRPIFGASALNWDGENPTPMLPKAWDGNGIPNTTTKYKEDQKVSWHATPFEERLLKVLSDEKLYSPSHHAGCN